MGYCFKDKKNETTGTTHGNSFHFKNTGLWFGSHYSHCLATPLLQGGSVGNWQVKVVEDVSLLWVWAKTQVSVVQPKLLDGKWLLFCLQRGLPVTLGLVASVKAACSTDALSSSLSDMQELSAEPRLSEALQRKPTAASQGKCRGTNPQTPLNLPPLPWFLPSVFPLPCWLGIAPSLFLEACSIWHVGS